MKNLIKKDASLSGRVNKFLKEDFDHSSEKLLGVVKKILREKDKIKNLTSKYSTPFYIYDEKSLDESIEEFIDAFRSEIPSFKAYYAIKIFAESISAKTP